MHDPQTHKRGHIVPKWLEYSKATRKGELVVHRKKPFEINKATRDSIKADLEDFKTEPTPELACRLMGAGIVLGDEQLSRDMATFVAKKGGVDSLSLKLADKVLSGGLLTRTDVNISKLRSWLSEYPKSAISWIELSRAFTIKGNHEKAKKAAVVALQLAPYDRYIARCAVRFFLHSGDFDLAWHYIKKASQYRFDPWIKATEVNVALISERHVPDIKKFIPRDLSVDQIFHYSELLESAGLLDLNAGKENKAKKVFRLAWTKPSENVITHAEWLIRNKLPGMRESTALDFEQSREATTWLNYVDLKLDKAIDAALEWELEEPYSKFPFLVGSLIACNAGIPELGAAIAGRGLQVAPHDIAITNNLCYALLRAGKVKEASKYIDKLTVKTGTDSDLFQQATLGLYELKTKNVIAGRQAYFDVINQFRQKGEYDLQAEALLNLALAELDVATTDSRILAIKSLEATEKMISPGVVLMRKLVQHKLNVNKETS